jgi:nucleoside-diphosphate-sugar epimerase
MRVFVAGATGAVGRRLVPLLLEDGHDVVAMTRSRLKALSLADLGAETVIADGLDRSAVMDAVTSSRPDVVIHEMTHLTGVKSLRNFDREFAATNRLRVEGTDNLLAAASIAGARRFVAQSFGNWYERAGSAVKSEGDPLDSTPPRRQRESFAAVRQLEHSVLNAADLEGVVLRYASFYGPGTAFDSDGEIAPLLRKRRFPIVGNGAGVWSFVHIDDVARATALAVDQGHPGIYNIADDEPAPVAAWLPAFASAVWAPPPRRIPVWLGRIAGGEVGVSMMTSLRGASNAKARRELGWTPRFRTWRDGFRFGLSNVPLDPETAGEVAR